MTHLYPIKRIAISVIFLLSASWSFATIYTVTTTADAGAGSLRQAIIDANTSPGLDTIAFNIAAAGAQVISPTSALPSVNDATFINGYSQPTSVIGTMAARTIRIVLRGAVAGAGVSGLTLNANNITVCGLAIHSFTLDGITVLNGADNLVIWGNFIGSDQNGALDLGNGNHGINLGDFGPGGSDNVIIGNNSDGIRDTDEGNLISGNGQDGVIGWALTNSIISGNFIGSNRAGIGTTLGNGRNGILLTVGCIGNRVGSNGDGINDGQEPNGIIRNTGRGILIAANSNANFIGGNVVGMNTVGAAAGNFLNGIEILNSSLNIISTNLVLSNVGHGVALTSQDFFGFNFNTVGNIIVANYIGVTPTNVARGNTGSGIALSAADGLFTIQNVIGSNNDGVGDDLEANNIANNARGISFTNSANISGNKISRNSIYSNTNLGIDFNSDGTTANDDGDGDTGPNELFNFPVIVVASKASGTDLVVRGISRPSAVIEVYLEDGSGEGRTFLFREQEGGPTDLATGDSTYSDPTFGTFTDRLFEFSIPLAPLIPIPGGSRLVALAIKPALNDSSTSEFGASLMLMPVSLTSFQGNLHNGKVYLTWNTKNESNSSHFIIEKSMNGGSYSNLGQVNSGVASGQYSFIDDGPLNKINYYRLQQVDHDDKAAYSRVLIIKNDISSVGVNISPNPVRSFMNISYTLEKKENIKIHLFDPMGRLVKRYEVKGNAGINTFNISDLNGLPAGIYSLELIGDGMKARQQIMKK